MKFKQGKSRFSRKLDRLEVYLLAADNPIGKRQFRLIFRRKRNKEVLTREQVTAIKRGRRVLRQEMKERGMKRRIDFEVTATNLGLFFDRNRLLFPFYLWLIRDKTALKVLATTAALTTLMTVIQPVIEYITEYVTQYLTQYVTQYVPEYITQYVTKIEKEYLTEYKDRFTISISGGLEDAGLELSETEDFANPSAYLTALPSWNIPCISIAQIPWNVDEPEIESSSDYFSYTFYCRYFNDNADQNSAESLSKYAIDYDWALRIHSEGVNTTDTDETSDVKVSDAVWYMVIQNGEVIISAKGDVDKDGNIIPASLPSPEVLENNQVAFVDRSIDYINTGLAKIDPLLNVDNINRLDTIFSTQREIDAIQAQIDAYFDKEGIQNLTRLMLRTEDWRDYYKIVATRDNFNYYQVVADEFVSDQTITSGTRMNMHPGEYDEYTVVVWLEGDDPQCSNMLMNGFIGLDFQIVTKGEGFMDVIVTPGESTEDGNAE